MKMHVRPPQVRRGFRIELCSDECAYAVEPARGVLEPCQDNDIRVDRAAARRHKAQEAARGNMTRSFNNRRRSRVIMEDCEGCHVSEDKGMMAVQKRWAATAPDGTGSKTTVFEIVMDRVSG